MGRTTPPRDLLPPNELAFTYRRAAAHTGLTKYAVSRLVQSGALKTMQIGDQRRITRASLSALIRELDDGPTPEAA
jgi:excisionase family DNA binding protein